MFTTNLVHLQKEYIDAGRFTVVKRAVGGGWVRTRSDFYDQTGLHFPQQKFSKMEYRPRFGPCFGTGGSMSRNDNNGLTGSVRRLTCKRALDCPGRHELLRDNQFANFGKLPGFKEWQDAVRSKYRGGFHRERLDPVEARALYADAVHPKREERLRALQFWRDSGLMGDTTRLPKNYVVYKNKSNEIIALGKYLRAIASLGPEATLSGAYLIDSIKDCFKETFYWRGGSATFVVPTDNNLSVMFENFINSKDSVQFVYFSDDSIINVRCCDGNFMGNVDISACDGSNYDPVFDFLRESFDAGADWDSMFEQLRSVCKISSLDVGSKDKVYLLPNGQVMYSGSSLTTIVNNMANLAIFISFMNQYHTGLSVEGCQKIIRDGACKVGYDVKVIVCNHIEEIQFLKCSPSINDGKLTVFQNLGVLLRSFGMSKVDLPGSGPWAERAKLFNSGVIAGCKGQGGNPVTDALKDKWCLEAEVPKYIQEELVWKGKSFGYTPAEGLARRYGVTAASIVELAQVCRHLHLEELYCSDTIDKIMEVDYGYDPAARRISVSSSIDTSFVQYGFAD